LKFHTGALFSEFVGDFVKDEAGIWWLINVKAFILDHGVYLDDLKRITHWDEEKPEKKKLKGRPFNYQKSVKCNYCEESYPAQKLTKKLNLRMMVEMDKH
jgi:hypothetical protein